LIELSWKLMQAALLPQQQAVVDVRTLASNEAFRRAVLEQAQTHRHRTRRHVQQVWIAAAVSSCLQEVKQARLQHAAQRALVAPEQMPAQPMR
jgi:hypothetical protein